MFHIKTRYTKMELPTTVEQPADETPSTDVAKPVEHNIYDVIARSKYPELQEYDYIYSPIIGRDSIWNPLGNKISSIEKANINVIPPNKYFTIRLDGKNFSTVVPILVRLGIFSVGVSNEFNNIMKSVAEYATTQICQNVLYIFTQSDEISIIIDKIHHENNADIPNATHFFAGRKDKILTITSAKISTYFQKLVLQLVLEKGMDINNILPNLPEMVFDARIGIYDSLDDAFELILWRAYDCSVNGVSNAIYLNKLGRKNVTLNTTEKLKLLNDNGKLPLTQHQAYGVLFAMKRELVTSRKQKHRLHEKMRKKYVLVEGNVICNVKEGQMVIGRFE